MLSAMILDHWSEADPQNPFDMGMRFLGDLRTSMRDRFRDLMGNERQRPKRRPHRQVPPQQSFQGHQGAPPAVFKDTNSGFQVIHVNDVENSQQLRLHEPVNHPSIHHRPQEIRHPSSHQRPQEIRHPSSHHRPQEIRHPSSHQRPQEPSNPTSHQRPFNFHEQEFNNDDFHSIFEEDQHLAFDGSKQASFVTDNRPQFHNNERPSFEDIRPTFDNINHPNDNQQLKEHNFFDQSSNQGSFGFSEIQQHHPEFEEKSEIIYENYPVDESNDWKVIPKPYGVLKKRDTRDSGRVQTIIEEIIYPDVKDVPLYYSDVQIDGGMNKRNPQLSPIDEFYEPQNIISGNVYTPTEEDEKEDRNTNQENPSTDTLKLRIPNNPKRRRQRVKNTKPNIVELDFDVAEKKEQRFRHAPPKYENGGGIMTHSGFKREISREDDSDDNKNPMVKSYEFGYGVKDGSSGSQYSHAERLQDGTKEGSYKVHLPDGRIQTVEYTANNNGYHPKITFEGEAKYPQSYQSS